MRSDEFNLVLAESVDTVDQINAQFYGQFPYPCRAVKFDCAEDPYFETVMLNQELGDWDHNLLPKSPRIWVAGCGTNQAVITALKFPAAGVAGSDLSSASLEICGHTARTLGVANLDLRQESINQVTYKDEFDYVISTGVIHHNADPQAALQQLASALKPSGILELMVYNRFHWTIPAAFQKAIRILGKTTSANFAEEMVIAKRIIGELPQETLIGVISKYRGYSDAMLADELLQPVLHHYTVESLADMAASCGLELLLPCLNQFDKSEARHTWNLEFEDPRLRQIYESLPDERRWQVTNLLLRDRSPWLWFYFQRKDSGRRGKPEKQVCEEFLERVFERAETQLRSFMQTADDEYTLMSNSFRSPSGPPPAPVRRIAQACDGKRTMRECFRIAGIETSFRMVNQARVVLTTPLFPYLKATRCQANQNGGSLQGSAHADDGQKKKREESRLNRFKNIKPVAVSLSDKEIVRTSTLRADWNLPLVIEPNGHEMDVVEWSRGNRPLLDRYLDRHGAVLFRGFAVQSAAQVEGLALTLCDELLRDNGEHQRGSVTDGVYTPVFYPSEQQLLWHNENSFNHRWPGRILFCCIEPAVQGGETPIVDSRKVYEAIDPRVREKFLATGVMYVRNYGSGLGLDWRAVFRTDSKQEVEEKCRAQRMEFEWKSGDELRTSCVRPAVIKHPRTGEPSWFNQAQHWHPWCLDEATRESTRKLFRTTDMPRNCYYGDGTLIEDREMDEILKAYKQLEVAFTWNRGDVMVLDNMLAAHGRNPFEGERRLLVTMGDMTSFDDVEVIAG